jgi:hypothetical protein
MEILSSLPQMKGFNSSIAFLDGKERILRLEMVRSTTMNGIRKFVN